MLEVADKLSEAVHYESDRIEALAQAVSREWKSFDMNINQRSCLLARSVAYHKHSEEVSYIQNFKLKFSLLYCIDDNMGRSNFNSDIRVILAKTTFCLSKKPTAIQK